MSEANEVDGVVNWPLKPTEWICPECGVGTPSNKIEWCGKNAKCIGCGEYHYYSEYVIAAI